MGKMKPHRAVIRVHMTVHEIMRTGESHGDTVCVEELEKCNLGEHFLLYVEGNDRYDCLRNVSNKIKQFQETNDDTP